MKRTVLLGLALALALALVAPGLAKKAAKPAEPTLPAYFTLPPNITVADGGGHVTYEVFGESTFWQGPSGSEKELTKQGQHWYAPLMVKGSPAIDGKAVWAQMKPALVAGGWTIPDEYDSNPFSAMMRYQKDGKDVWGYVKIFGSDDMRLNLVEVGSDATAFVINPPAATPEKFDITKADFPYLPPLPGSRPGTGSRAAGSMEVTLPGSDEVQLVGTGSMTRFYPNPPTLSTLQFVNTYRDGLTKAGWTIISTGRGADATVTAHYARNGRDLWAYLHLGGEEYAIKVADAGVDNDIARQMAKDCHVALYGVLFDFNKATLKPESDPVLQRVLAFLQKDPKMALEVQGHTDNVGGDDYNQKLSEARSRSVLTWLTQHGIAATRLSFKGYGKTRPVASNDTDEGRARNRRVEIARPGCTK